MATEKRWTIWKWDDERFGMTGPVTTDRIPEGATGVEAARASGVEVMPVEEHLDILRRACGHGDTTLNGDGTMTCDLCGLTEADPFAASSEPHS